jgi:radical SAM protein with 4Fe4S-binding SPASM domain
MNLRARPRTAAIELTLTCPCRCVTCGSNAGRPREGELTTAQWLDVIAQLAALGCERLSLLGGEPLCFVDWPCLVQAARDRGMLVEMITSGMGVDESVAIRLAHAGLVSVTVSVDGLAHTHDQQRRVPGCHAQALCAIRRLDQAGLKVGVTTQVNQATLPELEVLAASLQEAGVLGWQLQLTMPAGRAGHDIVLPPARMPELHRTLTRLGRRPGLRPRITDNIGYCTADDTRLRTLQGGLATPWLGCTAGILGLGITSDGRVKGCLAMPNDVYEGSLKTESLATIWGDANRFAFTRRYNETQLAGPCATCTDARRCRGGCTALAMSVHGRPGISTHCLRLHTQPADA